MKRRSFIKKAAAATAGAVIAPYILPSGRLFAQTGSRIANHVVFVLFAGGLRQEESVYQQFVEDQPDYQNNTTGNIMNRMLAGSAPSQTHGIYMPWPNPGADPNLPAQPLEGYGTLFQEVRFNGGPPGHYNAHAIAMTGSYFTTGLNQFARPPYPTLFEYYRKHSDPAKSATNAWWLSHGLGPYPSLNYSDYAGYGSEYGANYLQPLTTFGAVDTEINAFLNSIPACEFSNIDKIRTLLNNNFDKAASELPGIKNTEANRQQLKDFILATSKKAMTWPTPDGTSNGMTGDLFNIAYAWEVLDEFKPELMVINTFNCDACHDNFGTYIDTTHKADYGIGWLWNKIQSDPVLKDDTIMICMPEHGRNKQPNSIIENGLRAYDHTIEDVQTGETPNSRKVFALVAGPQSVVKQQKYTTWDSNSGNPETVDIVPTIGDILGFDTPVVNGKSLVTYFTQ